MGHGPDHLRCCDARPDSRIREKQILDALDARWEASLLALTATERARLTGWFPHLGPVVTRLMIENRDGKDDAVPHLAPTAH